MRNSTKNKKVKLTNWRVINLGYAVCLSGCADEHPSLGKNAQISSTSKLVNVIYDNDTIICETLNTIYEVEWKFMDTTIENIAFGTRDTGLCGHDLYNKYLDILNVIHNGRLDSFINFSKYKENITPYEECIRIERLIEQGKEEIKRIKQETNNKLIREAMKYENCLYIELYSISTGSTSAYNIDGKQGIIEPKVHIGTFTDTVLYSECINEKDRLDLRYYVGFGSMETYSWTENIQTVVIKNDKGNPVLFNNQEIKPGEIKEFHRWEEMDEHESLAKALAKDMEIHEPKGE